MLEDQQTRIVDRHSRAGADSDPEYLFSQTNTDHSDERDRLRLIPHIVRARDVSDLNEQSIEVGTANAIQLRRPTKRPPRRARQRVQRTGREQGMARKARQQRLRHPDADSVAAPSDNARGFSTRAVPAGGSAAFMFDPANGHPGDQGQLHGEYQRVRGRRTSYSVPLQVSYDPKLLQVVNVSNGGFLSQDGQAVALVHRDDETTGTVQITATRPPGAGGVSGQGSVVTLTFMAKASGTGAADHFEAAGRAILRCRLSR